LAGELSSSGWWYYHLAAFLFKTPLPLFIASIVAICLWISGRWGSRYNYCVFIPIVLIFVANSLFNSLYIGVRHVLPAYPLLFIIVSPLLATPITRVIIGSRKYVTIVWAVVTCIGMAWFVGGSLSIAPRYLEYFNEIAGGPADGHHMLIDSNLDWGQDLIRLKEYMDSRDLTMINLAYFGRVHPGIYGIRFQSIEREISHGITAISASFLMGRPYFSYQNNQVHWVGANTYTWLQKYDHIDRVGSMFIFDLPQTK
jgi:hypothetical protein